LTQANEEGRRAAVLTQEFVIRRLITLHGEDAARNPCQKKKKEKEWHAEVASCEKYVAIRLRDLMHANTPTNGGLELYAQTDSGSSDHAGISADSRAAAHATVYPRNSMHCRQRNQTKMHSMADKAVQTEGVALIQFGGVRWVLIPDRNSCISSSTNPILQT